MKKIFYFLFIVFCFSAFVALAQPKIEIIGGDTYNWGQVKENQNPLKAKVQIKNAGTEKLIINEVKPTCGCTTAPLDKSELSAGEIATLDISLRISGHGNDISKSVKINSNDKTTPTK